MITVKIDESDLLDLLMERVEYLIDDVETQGLFREYYSTMVECMDGMELDINKIVDNDYYNNFNVYESIEDIMHEFNENKEEVHDRIIAEYKGLYLVRSY